MISVYSRFAAILRKLGVEIYQIKIARSGSAYFETNRGIVRISDHAQIKRMAGQKAPQIELRLWMKEDRIAEILVSSETNLNKE